MRKAGADPSYPLITEDGPAFVPSKGWAEMIRKVYEVDPLLCPTCGGRMSLISFIAEIVIAHRLCQRQTFGLLSLE